MGSPPDAATTLARLQADGRLPSVVAAVARGGAPEWTGGVGADPGTAYRIGSITKTLTAVLVLQAAEDGLLDLDEPVGRHVPECGYADATVRSLLDHTSGMQSEPVGAWWERSPGVDPQALLAANDGSGRVADPGSFFHYSNLGYALLGEAVARVRGQTWWELVRERLLEPLGMRETGYDRPPGGAEGRSVGHFAGTLTAEPATDTGAMAPAGQLWSTVADLLRWADFWVTGHPEILDAATLATMRRPADGADYGLGFQLRGDPARPLAGHTGSMPGFQAALFVDPDTRDAAAVLANSTTGLPADRVASLLLDGDPDAPDQPPVPWRPTARVPAAAAELLGVWFWGNTGFGMELRNDHLELRSLRTGALGDRFALGPGGDHGDGDGDIVGVSGYHRGERLRVHRRGDGTVGHLECATFVYTRTPYPADVPIPGGHPG